MSLFAKLNSVITFSRQNISQDAIQNYLKIMKNFNEEDETDLFLDIDSMLEMNDALSKIYCYYTGRELLIDDNNDILMELDLNFENDREFIQALNGFKLPDLKYLKCINFYESDIELELLLTDLVSSVDFLHLAAESYWFDANEFVEMAFGINGLQHLYLNGFLIDGDDLEKLFTNHCFESLTFIFWNLAIEDDFSIDFANDDNMNSGSASSKLLSSEAIDLNTLRFIQDETSPKNMQRLVKIVTMSELKNTLKEISFFGWRVSRGQL